MITYYLGNGTTEPIIKVTISETDVPGELKFTISQSGPVVGDLRGLFIDSIESLAAGSLTVVDAVYTYASGAQWHLDTAGEVGSLDFRSDEGSIVNLGGGANMSGALGTSGDGYDFGMEIGLEGIGNKGTYDDGTKIADDIRAIEFTLQGATLSLDDFLGVDIGVRLTSVGLEGGSRTGSLKLTGTTPENQAPVAVGDSATTDEDTAVQISVLDNDSDELTLTAANITAEDGAHGKVVVNPDGTLTYTPDKDFFGTDSFTYTLTDHAGLTSTTTVTITVNPVNDAPVAAPGSAAGDEDTLIQGQVAASDVDGDSLTYALVDGARDAAGNPVAGLTFNADGSYSFQGPQDFNGTVTFT